MNRNRRGPPAEPGKVNLHGKVYKTVALRTHEFRQQHSIAEGWAILTEVIDASEDSVTMVARVLDPTGRIVATGHAQEVRATKGVNSTSALENCETSAIGRALSSAGFGGDHFASADEVASAIQQQEQQRRPQQGRPPQQRQPQQPPQEAANTAPRLSEDEARAIGGALSAVGAGLGVEPQQLSDQLKAHLGLRSLHELATRRDDYGSLVRRLGLLKVAVERSDFPSEMKKRGWATIWDADNQAVLELARREP